jgi:WD40 repeat protein
MEKHGDINRSKMISALAFSPDSRRLAFGSFMRTAGEAEAREFSRLPANHRLTPFVPDAMSHDLVLLDPATLAVTNAFSSSHSGTSVRELFFTPDGRFLVSGAAGKSVAVHEVGSGTAVIISKDFEQPAHPVLSHDGKFVAVGTGQEVRLYELRR